jgi:telomere length regulation protein
MNYISNIHQFYTKKVHSFISLFLPVVLTAYPAMTRVLLLSAGYVHRSNQAYLSTLARSSVYLNAISHRLAASSPRARFLGMITGVAISDLVDPSDKKMKFDVDEMNSPDAHWYRGLTKIRDSVGSVADLKMTRSEEDTPRTALDTTPKTKALKTDFVRERLPPSGVTSKIISIEEIGEVDDMEGNDLVAYEKPDSDAEDEDEDPTLVQRNKPTAPV